MKRKKTLQTLPQYLEQLQENGRCTFSQREALSAIGGSPEAFKKAALRLITRQKLIRIQRGFFAILLPAYRRLGCLPADWFIDKWMQFLRTPYYVSTLSAAALHGAAHQQPQEYQVMVQKPLRSICKGQVSIRFVYKKLLINTPTQKFKTPTGYIQVSTPEATAADLVKYMRVCGGLGNVCTLLQELSENIIPERLVQTIEQMALELPNVQRLGFILESLGLNQIVKPLSLWIQNKKMRYVVLRSDLKSSILEKNTKWNILINDIMEPDL